MFYIADNEEKVILFDRDLQRLQRTIKVTQPNLKDLEIKEFDENKYMVLDGDIVTKEEYEEVEARKERERLDSLSLTKREVFLALHRDKGITPEQIKAQISDPEVLIEFEYATEYLRGNPLVNSIGETLGYTPKQLDYLFEYKQFPAKEENAE